MIRPANPQDLPAIAAIYEAILAEEDARPVSFTNWQRGKYPTVDTARAALEAGTLFTAEENGEVYGCVNLKGLTSWEKAEALISVAHPDFREQLIAEADKMHIWRRSNKR